MIPDATMAAFVRQLRERGYQGLADGGAPITLEVSPLALLAFLDAAEGIAPRNVPSILRDAAIDRMEAIADRLEQLALAQDMRVGK